MKIGLFNFVKTRSHLEQAIFHCSHENWDEHQRNLAQNFSSGANWQAEQDEIVIAEWKDKFLELQQSLTSMRKYLGEDKWALFLKGRL